MKVKKVIILYLALAMRIVNAGPVYHTLISTTEQTILGHTFKHIMTCAAAEKDEFFIDGALVAKDFYTEQFEALQKKEWEQEIEQREHRRRTHLQFAEMVQVEVAAKLLNKIIADIRHGIDRVKSPELEKFFIFSARTIDSENQLVQLQSFVDQIALIAEKKIADKDVPGINLLYTKLEQWPNRLEQFFQDTVQNAIKTSDDTTMLKELLKLVSESSLAD